MEWIDGNRVEITPPKRCKKLTGTRFAAVPIYIPIKSLVPTKIIRSNNATVVFWNDDTKTVVKRSQNTLDDPYNAFCAALGIKLYGTNSALKRAIREAGGLPDAQDREAGGLPDATKEATP